MKKIIAAVCVTMLVMSVICGVLFVKVNRNYNDKLDQISADYESNIRSMNSKLNEVQNKYDELYERNQDLEENVYKYMETKEPYEITIRHDGELHQWYATKRGLFGNGGHMIVY